ncbi:hypothetical protein MUK42_25351 [Musa troglodytarum]|uniref:Glycine-rich protein n=1 Tax=Musa troglodytarum TaxID=320322 RepID=A0A9E7GNV7_9LILI|nr:hypothetical protein MUK42_25351 [Musa troglodytarum]
MERSTKMVLLLALLLATFVVGLESRKLQKEAVPYQPQNLHGAHGGFGPFFGGAPAIGFGKPFHGLVPGFGSVPAVPGGSGDRVAAP